MENSNKFLNILRRSYKKYTFWGFVSFLFTLMSNIGYLDIQSCDSASHFTWFIYPAVFIIAVWCTLFAATSFIVALIKKNERLIYLVRCFGFLVPILSIFLAALIGIKLEALAKKKIVINGDEIVQKVEQFKTDKGYYPNNLTSLVPKYMHNIPSTGICSKPNFRYRTENNNYVISARIGLMGILIFSPNGSYNEPQERIGAWLYFVD